MVLVARTDGVFSGYLIGAPSQSRENAWILRLRVTEFFRRQGVGMALLGSVCSRMKADGVKRMLLSCSSDNEPALALYGKAGFIVDGNEPEYFGTGEDRLILSCQL